MYWGTHFYEEVQEEDDTWMESEMKRGTILEMAGYNQKPKRKGDLSKLPQQQQVPRVNVSVQWDDMEEKLQCMRVPSLSGKPNKLLQEKMVNKQF